MTDIDWNVLSAQLAFIRLERAHLGCHPELTGC
jgi:hypothetical protein